MSESDIPSSTDDFDFFDAIYRGDGPFDRAPWDIGGPQPAYVDLEAAGGITGGVLDCGCGTGDNALFLASKGYTVIGVDRAPTAIAIAREKARQRGLAATFDTADALELADYPRQFDTVIDSGLAHVFESPGDLARYAAALHRSCRGGARAYVLALSDRAPAYLRDEHGDMVARIADKLGGTELQLDRMLPALTPDALRSGFAAGWSAESIDTAVVRSVLPFQTESVDLPAWLGSFRAVADK